MHRNTLHHRLLRVAIATVAPCLPTLASAAPPTASPDRVVASATPKVVYHWTKSVGPDGRVEEHTPVRTILDRLDEPDYWIDIDRLEDSQGRSFRVEADAWQDEGEQDVHYEIKMVEVETVRETYEERARRWARDPDEPGVDFATYLAEKRARPAVRNGLVDDLDRWAAEAGPDDTIDVVVVLDQQLTRKLPKLSRSMFGDEPALALSQMESRIIAIEQMKTAAEDVQRPMVEDLKGRGATILEQYWVLNGFEARVRAGDLRVLEADPTVRRVERRVEPTPDTNDLDEMREATQIVQLHDANFTGEQPSGASTIADMHLAVIDDSVDADHPAWDDWSGGPSRLVDIWRETAGVWGTVAVSATALPSHGTKVAAIALADLMQGQDAAYPNAADQDDRTGFAPEASFSFIESSAGTTDAVQKAIDESVDIINLSVSNGYSCDLGHSTNAAVDAAALADIFVAKSAGSNGGAGTCNIGNPGTASGSFTVTAYDRTAVPLVTGMVLGGSSHGPDAYGRAVVAISAPAGTEGSTTAAFDDTYGAFGATSAATPVIAGSAAVLENHLSDVFGSTLIDQVEYMHASMIMMSDGENAGGFVGANVPLDDDWGAGRFRARLLTAEGMDAPWRMRLIGTTIEDGETESDLLVNPSGGVNQPLSADVDRLRAGVYWHEPNLELSAGDTASIKAYVCRSTGCYGSGTSTEERQRLLLGNVAGGETWNIQLSGYDVPDSQDPDYFFNQDKRKVYIAVYFEDGDRDDANGPGADIQ